MKRSLFLSIVFCLESAPLFANTNSWTGYLVDSHCYDSQENNVSIVDGGSIDVNHDRGREVQVCHPKLSTSSFTLVDPDGQSVRLDANGNAMASNLVREAEAP